MTDVNDTITVPRWAAEFIMENASFQDEGPFGEGWRSAAMKRATDAIEQALANRAATVPSEDAKFLNQVADMLTDIDGDAPGNESIWALKLRAMAARCSPDKEPDVIRAATIAPIEHRKIADALCDIANDLSDDWKDEKRVMRQAVEALRSRCSPVTVSDSDITVIEAIRKEVARGDGVDWSPSNWRRQVKRLLVIIDRLRCSPDNVPADFIEQVGDAREER